MAENEPSLSDRINAALANPLIGIGVGMLGAPRGSTVGQALSRGVGTATDLRARSAALDLSREGLLARKAEREKAEQQRQAWGRLLKLLGLGSSAPDTAAAAAAVADPAASATVDPSAPPPDPAEVPVIDEVAGMPTSLLGAFDVSASGGVPGSAPDGAPGAGPGARETVMGLLAASNPELFQQGLIGQIFAAPAKAGALEVKLAQFRQRFGREPNEDEFFRLAGGGTTINNVTEKDLDKVVPVSDLEKIILPDGSRPKIGATWRDIRSAGGEVVTSAEQSDQDKTNQALTLLEQLRGLAIGSEENPGIFAEVEPGLLNRGKKALDFVFDWLEQGDPRASQYQDLSAGAISSLVRSLGEKGALSDGDVERALNLLPTIFPLPDTGKVAQGKLNELERLIARGTNNLERGIVVGKGKGGGSDVPATGAGGVEGFVNRLPGEKAELEKLTDDEVLKRLGIR